MRKEGNEMETQPFRADLVQVLADHIRTVKEEAFSMATWHSRGSSLHCAMTHCMGGEACMLAPFIEAGLELYESDGSLVPYYRPTGSWAFVAMAQVLSISIKEAIDLFMPYDRPVPWWPSMPLQRHSWTPKIAAEVLETFLLWRITGQVRQAE